MKLLFVTNDLRAFRDHRKNLAEHAVRQAYQADISYGAGDEARPFFEAMGLRLFSNKMDLHAFRPWQDVGLIGHYRKLVQKGGYNLIHAITIKPVLYMGIALCLLPKGQRPAFVATLPGLGKVFEPSPSLLRRLRKAIVAKALRFIFLRTKFHVTFENASDAAFFVSQNIADFDHVHALLGAGIDLSAFQVSTQDAKTSDLTVLFAARPLTTKGTLEFIKAAKAVHLENPSVKFVLAGDVDKEDVDRVDIPKALADEGLTGKDFIQYVGLVSSQEMPDLLQAADIVCLPTMLREGFPRVLIEAAACGCALMATDQPSIRQILKAGENGWFVDPKNQTDFNAIMVEACANREKIMLFGAKSQALVAEMRLSDLEIAKDFDVIYHRALEA